MQRSLVFLSAMAVGLVGLVSTGASAAPAWYKVGAHHAHRPLPPISGVVHLEQDVGSPAWRQTDLRRFSRSGCHCRHVATATIDTYDRGERAPAWHHGFGGYARHWHRHLGPEVGFGVPVPPMLPGYYDYARHIFVPSDRPTPEEYAGYEPDTGTGDLPVGPSVTWARASYPAAPHAYPYGPAGGLAVYSAGAYGPGPRVITIPGG